MTLKEKFLNAIISGELGTQTEHGAIVTLKDFKRYFSDIETDYVGSFLPVAVIEAGRTKATATKFVFRVKRGVYRVHPEALAEQKQRNLYHVAENDKDNPEVKEHWSAYITIPQQACYASAA